MTIVGTSPGAIQFASTGYAVNEADGTVEIEVERIGGSAGAASAEISTGPGTATADTDYTSIPDLAPVVVTWADGDDSTRTVSIAITDDGVDELNESFIAQILSTTGAATGTPAVTTVTISGTPPPPPGPTATPDPGSTPNPTPTASPTPTPSPTPEPTPTLVPRPAGEISFVTQGYTVTEEGGTVEIELQRTHGHHGEVSVLVATSSSSAVAGDDYTPILAAIPTRVSWADGELGVKKLAIPILADGEREADEAFSVQIISAEGASAPYATGSITVVITETPVEKAAKGQGSGDSANPAAVRKVTDTTKHRIRRMHDQHMMHMNDAGREFAILDDLAVEAVSTTNAVPSTNDVDGLKIALALLIPLGIGVVASRQRTWRRR